jgi:DNA-binding MarR family transcriptional regulator
MSLAFTDWVVTDAQDADVSFQAYLHDVANARYLVRKVVRIVDEQAKQAGLDPLEHQALVQIAGISESEALSINELAERVDVPPALSSRLVKSLVSKQLAERLPSASDRRVTLVRATDTAWALLKDIDRRVHLHIDYFQKQLKDSDRISLMAIFAFWVGLDADSHIGDAIRAAVADRAADHARSSKRRKPRQKRVTPSTAGVSRN